jgi:hypothetical protein
MKENCFRFTLVFYLLLLKWDHSERTARVTTRYTPTINVVSAGVRGSPVSKKNHHVRSDKRMTVMNIVTAIFIRDPIKRR